ncbi:MAG: DUF3035 domain-containing protein [Pseudomonadota bacterium]
MTSHVSLRIAFLCLGVGALSACSSIGNPFEALAKKKPTPDEFAVVARAPLVLPGSRSLPEPTPGAPSPLDPNPQQDAIVALTGTSGDNLTSTQPSAGENALLSSANAAAASAEIRVQLEQDEIDIEENEPYEAPLVSELLFGPGEEEIDEETLLDPDREARRLQTSGVIAPVNPNEVPPAAQAEEDAGDGRSFSYDTSQTGGRPNNTISNQLE